MLYIVMVLYKTRLEDSLTYKAVKRNLDKLKTLGTKILIYNNSPEIDVPLSDEYLVYTPTENLMLAGAYNYALEQANCSNSKWLLLLDQDTELTKEYFDELTNFLINPDSENYDVVVPILKKDNIILSPEVYKKNYPFGTSRKITTNTDISKIKKNEIFAAFNSSTLLRVDLLKMIGGFGNEFPLDMLDHYYFYKLNQVGARFYVMHATFQQNLSVLDKDSPMSTQRYALFVQATQKYVSILGFRAVISFKIRLLFRIILQIISPLKRRYVILTIRQLFRF